MDEAGDQIRVQGPQAFQCGAGIAVVVAQIRPAMDQLVLIDQPGGPVARKFLGDLLQPIDPLVPRARETTGLHQQTVAFGKPVAMLQDGGGQCAVHRLAVPGAGVRVTEVRIPERGVQRDRLPEVFGGLPEATDRSVDSALLQSGDAGGEAGGERGAPPGDDGAAGRVRWARGSSGPNEDGG